MMMQKLTSVAATLAFLAARAEAQVTVDGRINAWRCPTAGGNFCTGAVNSIFIVHCEDYIGKLKNCRYQLFDLYPRGAKDAWCYQADLIIGNASCAWDRIAYPENGDPYAIPDLSTTATPFAVQDLSTTATPFAIQDLSTTATPSATPVPRATSEAAVSPDINGPSQPLRECNDSETLPEFALEGICNSPTSSRITTLATFKAEISPDINGPSQPLRECNDSETLPEFALEGICNFPTSSRITPLATFKAEISPDINGPSQPLRECNESERFPEFALEGICNFPTGLKTRIPARLKAEISPDINGPSQALRECNDSDTLPEFALEGLCNLPDATYGVSTSSNAKRELAIKDASKSSSTKSEGTDNETSSLEPATTTVALHTGSANIHGVGKFVVGAEVLALTLFLLAN